MKIEKNWIFEKCLSNNAARHDYKEEWEANRFLIDEKMFAMLGQNKEGIDILTLKAEPEMGELLRKQYPNEITAGYYMNKVHWNSVPLENKSVPLELVEDMISASYNLIFKSLSKKRQKELLDPQQ